MIGEKTANKTAVSPRNGATIPLGAHPGNTGGKKGRSGRKTDAFRELCRELASADATLAAVREILSDAKHPAFIGALKWASENGFGRPQQSMDLTTGGERISYVMHVPEKAPDSATWAARYRQRREPGKQR